MEVTECRKVTVSKWQKFVLFVVCVAGIKDTTTSVCCGGFGGGGGNYTFYACLI
jgi:hypothetical protein